MKRISQHTAYLAFRLYHGMISLTHHNGQPLCIVYNDVPGRCAYGDPDTQGATVAFNLVRGNGDHIGQNLVESQANMQGIYLRSGGLCNAGGIASYLNIEPWQHMRAWSQGHRCGEPGMDNINGKPTGVVRVSLGAMSTIKDVDTFLTFLETEYIETERAFQVARLDEYNMHWGLETVPASAGQDSGFAASYAQASEVQNGNIPLTQAHLKKIISTPSLRTIKPLVTFAPIQARTYHDYRPTTAGSQFDTQYRNLSIIPRRPETARYMIPVDSLRMYDTATGEKSIRTSQSQVFLSNPSRKPDILRFFKGRKHAEAKTP
jgi:hypothetical protein